MSKVSGSEKSSERRFKAPRKSFKDEERPSSIHLQSNSQQLSPNESVVSEGSSSVSHHTSVTPSPLASNIPVTTTIAPTTALSAPNGKASNTDQAVQQFNEAKVLAKRRIKHQQSSTARLINSLADITVCLLARAMTEGINNSIEIRVYKKPVAVKSGSYAVAEYKNAEIEKKKKVVDPKLSNAEVDSDFNVITVGELMSDSERDNINNWKEFFNVCQSSFNWWRYCLAVHRRIGFRTNLHRSFLNMVDSRLLGIYSNASVNNPVSSVKINNIMKPDEQYKLLTLKRENEKLRAEIRAQNLLLRKLADDVNEQQEIISIKESINNDPIYRKIPVFVVFANAERTSVDSLRNLVGSIHRFRSADFHSIPKIVIYSVGYHEKYMQEMKYWFNVELIDFNSDLFQLRRDNTSDNHNLESHLDLIEALILVDSARKFNVAVLLNPEIVFTSENISFAIRSVIDSFGYGVKLNLNNSIDIVGISKHGNYFSILEGYIRKCVIDSCPSNSWKSEFLQTSVASASVSKSINGEYISNCTNQQNDECFYFCYINLRDDLLYIDTALASPTNLSKVETEFTSNICLGVPTVGLGLNTFTDSKIIQTFLPSLIKSLRPDELEKFKFTIYIAYDSYDVIWDNEENLREIKQAIKVVLSQTESIEVRYIKLPFSNAWLTFIWNKLFILGMKEGCDYFYQVNDDLIFNDQGWANFFTRSLSSKSNVGVAGPYDPKWKCTLLTQAFVSRKHLEIFGWLFPPEIKDWYSDFWITKIYQPDRMVCSENFKATNTKEMGIRYQLCNRPKWNEAVQRDMKTLSQHFISNGLK